MANHIVFFFTGNNVEFANTLCRAGVEAYALKGNDVALDKDQLDLIPIRNLPVWVWRNFDDINNPLKTRPCEENEWPGGRWDHIVKTGKYILVTMMDIDGVRESHAHSISFNSLQKAVREAEVMARLYRELNTKYEVAVVVEERETGNILYTAQV